MKELIELVNKLNDRQLLLIAIIVNCVINARMEERKGEETK